MTQLLNGGVLVIVTTEASKRLLPSRIQLLRNVFEKPMETRASVTPVCGGGSLGMDASQCQRHTEPKLPAGRLFLLQTQSRLFWCLRQEGKG